jgi:hypothetical protein
VRVVGECGIAQRIASITLELLMRQSDLGAVTNLERGTACRGQRLLLLLLLQLLFSALPTPWPSRTPGSCFIPRFI